MQQHVGFVVGNLFSGTILPVTPVHPDVFLRAKDADINSYSSLLRLLTELSILRLCGFLSGSIQEHWNKIAHDPSSPPSVLEQQRFVSIELMVLGYTRPVHTNSRSALAFGMICNAL